MLFPSLVPNSWTQWRDIPPGRWGRSPPSPSLPLAAPHPLPTSPNLAFPFP
uniref:Uncharacterized protein n=1 Tax=Macaca fascicularis TaxID=9541 RepID=A0A7N9D375_MACFA